RAKTICSSVNRDFFIGTTSVQGSVYHAGILFLNGTGFWVRVTAANAGPETRAEETIAQRNTRLIFIE
ncbi:hypothetical protein, partial [Klebsiella grimontii]|uniref:hypothetical protein n=1 Tax=Klebsiella grimontii TaxID=2058152 RepID=UPI001C49B9CE